MQVECPSTEAWENWTKRIFKHLTFASETKFAEPRRFGNMRPGLNPFSFSSPPISLYNGRSFPPCRAILCAA
jgi:hypothetical protein